MTFSLDEGRVVSHKYSYLVADIRDNKIIAELPFSGCSYDFKLNEAGTFTGNLQINPTTLLLDPKTATTPGRNALYALRDGKVVWGGIIWGSTYSLGTRTLNVSAESFYSYFFKIFNKSTKAWADTEQLDIARWLVENSGITETLLMSVDGMKSGRLLPNKLMYGYEFRTIGEEFSALASVHDGFEFDILVYQDSVTKEILRKLKFYYPQKGRLPEKSDLEFNYPGSISEFEAQFDAKEGANIVYTIGAGQGSEQLSKSATDESQIEAGWPRLEISRSYGNEYKLSTLESYAAKILNLKKSPVTVYTVSVRPDGITPFGSYSVGDWAKFTVDDPFLGNFSVWQRIVEISVSVENDGTESITLTVDAGQEPVEDETDDII